MKYGKYKFGILIFVFVLLKNIIVYSEEKIKSVPLINLEELSPTFEEDKDELEKMEKKNVNLSDTENTQKDSDTKENDKIQTNPLTCLMQHADLFYPEDHHTRFDLDFLNRYKHLIL